MRFMADLESTVAEADISLVMIKDKLTEMDVMMNERLTEVDISLVLMK